MGRRMLRWFRHVERINKYHLARIRVSGVKVSGTRGLGKPRLGWINSVKFALGSRGMTVEAVIQCVKDRMESRALVHM